LARGAVDTGGAQSIGAGASVKKPAEVAVEAGDTLSLFVGAKGGDHACDDLDACTFDLCNGDGGCANPMRDDACRIADECVPAGALTVKRFAREITESFTARFAVPDAEQGTAEIPGLLPEELAKKRFLFVRMGELDRLNKEGHSQSAGDAGLEAVVAAARDACSRTLGDAAAAQVDVIRYGGNEFIVELGVITDDQLAAIEGGIANAELELKNFAGIETPPLSFHATDLNEIMGIVASVEPDGLSRRNVRCVST
jgi:hypothetical protein